MFEDGVVISIGESEVDDLYIIAVTGNQDIAWLEVTMDDLLAVDIRQGVHQLIDHLATGFLGRFAFKKTVEGNAINVFHHDTGTDLLVHLLGVSLHDVGMVELHHQGILFFQQLEIDRLLSEFKLQTFQQEPSPLPLHLRQLVEAPALQRFEGSIYLGRQDKLFLDWS